MKTRHVIAALSIAGIFHPLPTAMANTPHSTNLYGALGLNTVPSARMDKTGTIRAQISHLDPYVHAFMGMQIAAPLYIGIRQSAEFSSLKGEAKRLYPGIDAKLRFVKETAHMPEISFGMQSGLGHKRQSGEYLALSKRYKDFDFTGGIGWGRFATAAHIDNPLKSISNHFGKDRNINGESPNKPQNWLTGENIGFFGGIEYFTPLNGLSLKADYGGDRYQAEKAAFDYRPAAPWSIGFNYKPWDFADIGIAAQGTDKIMARLSLQGNTQNWLHRSKIYKSSAPLAPYRTDTAAPGAMQNDALKDKIALSYISTNQHTAEATLKYSPHHSAPAQFGKAATHMANNAGQSIEEIIIKPTSLGLRGPSIHLMRRSLESALAHNNGSTDEIWHTSEIKHDFNGLQKFRPHQHNDTEFKGLSFLLDNQFSLSEEETSVLRRTSLIVGTTGPHKFKYLSTGFGLRLNLSDNLGKLRRKRPKQPIPIKSDVYDFADRFFAVDTAYTAATHTIMPDLHASAIAGYVDENFLGFGSEILYRPFNKRFAIGGEGWLVKKRDPFTFANLGTKDETLLTAHLNGWYDIPNADITLGLKAGRYLAKDFGTSLNITKNFKNGASLEGYVSISDKADADPFGGTTHADHGLRFTLPLGGLKYTPNTNVRITAAPFGRDIGQTVNNPLPLYKATEPFSLSHITRHWGELND